MSMSSTAERSTGDAEDERWMRLALELAAGGEGLVEPNPMVGCVIVRDGTLLAGGFHRAFGGPHAEIDALQQLEKIPSVSPKDAKGATAYVTLEPCCHHGKTPPCSQALVRANVSRVVVAMRDPFPKVDGGGIEQLRAAGIRVDVGVLEREAQTLNLPYLKRLRTGKPWAIAKWAMTPDGKIATSTGESQWISGPESRAEVHRLRARVDAIIVGMGTVLADDPMLNARLPSSDSETNEPARIAKRVVLCRRRVLSTDSKLAKTAREIPTWVFASPAIDPRKLAGLEELGVRVFRLEADDAGLMVNEMLARLGDESMTNVMIEAGPALLGSFLGGASAALATETASQIDECHVFVGPKLFGGTSAPGPIAGRGFDSIAGALKLELARLDRFGQDVRMIYRVEHPRGG